MNQMYGANTEALESAAAQLDQAADQLDRQAGALTSQLGNLQWLGTVAVRFTDAWMALHKPGLAHRSDFLRQGAEMLRKQAAEQRRASDGDGMASPRPRGGSVIPFESRENQEALGEQSRVVSVSSILERGRALEEGTFEIMKVSDDPPRYIVNLRGIDFVWNDPWSRDHLQDLDAASAARLTGNDAYAGRVKLEMERAGVPPGAEVMLVGHSAGAIAAMNIAGDADFNRTGGDGYHVNVTHVVAAGAGLRDWIDDPPGHTNVLMSINHNDVVAAGIQSGDFGLSGAGTGSRGGAIVNDIFDITDVQSKSYGEGRVLMEFYTNDGALGHDYSNYIKGFNTADSGTEAWMSDAAQMYFAGGGKMQVTTVSVPDNVGY